MFGERAKPCFHVLESSTAVYRINFVRIISQILFLKQLKAKYDHYIYNENFILKICASFAKKTICVKLLVPLNYSGAKDCLLATVGKFEV